MINSKTCKFQSVLPSFVTILMWFLPFILNHWQGLMILSKLMWERYWILAKVTISSFTCFLDILHTYSQSNQFYSSLSCGDITGASLSVSRPTNAAGMPTEGEDIVTQEQFFAFIEQEIRKIDLFTKRMVSHDDHLNVHFLHPYTCTSITRYSQSPTHLTCFYFEPVVSTE